MQMPFNINFLLLFSSELLIMNLHVFYFYVLVIFFILTFYVFYNEFSQVKSFLSLIYHSVVAKFIVKVDGYFIVDFLIY